MFACLAQTGSVTKTNFSSLPGHVPPPSLLPSHRGSRINVFVCQEASPDYLFHLFIYIFPQKPRAVSLATARFINICSCRAQRHSALVNALLQHNRLCAFSHSISTSSKTLAEQLGCVSCVSEEGWQGVSLTFSQRPSLSKLIFLPLAATVGGNDDK